MKLLQSLIQLTEASNARHFSIGGYDIVLGDTDIQVKETSIVIPATHDAPSEGQEYYSVSGSFLYVAMERQRGSSAISVELDYKPFNLDEYNHQELMDILSHPISTTVTGHEGSNVPENEYVNLAIAFATSDEFSDYLENTMRQETRSIADQKRMQRNNEF